MKLQGKGIDQFLARPNPEICAVLVYGPDHGLINERSRTVAARYFPDLKDLNDPFRVTFLDGDEAARDPARLNDEAGTMSLMGGKRLIWIKDADDGITAALKLYLENNADAFVVLEAGELGPKSSLRKLCEDHARAASLPCYADDEGALAPFVQSTLREAGIDITRDALMLLSSRLVGDRRMARSEIEKLIIYAGDQKQLDIEDIQAVCSDGADLETDQMVYALGGGNAVRMIRVLERLYGEGMASIALIRAVIRHVQRLHLTKSRIESGIPAQQAIKQLQPPLFFKLEAEFGKQLQRFTLQQLDSMLSRLQRLELLCKNTGTPDQIVTAQEFLRVAAR